MKAALHPSYKPETPEAFNWSLLDSPKASAVAEELASRIRGESLLVPVQRQRTAGARLALQLIAGIFDL